MNLFIKLMSSGLIVQVFMILTTLVFTRIYSVEDFGELAFYASYGSIMAVTSNLRFDYLNLKEEYNNKYVGYLVSNIATVITNIFLVLLLFSIDSIFGLFSKYNLYYLFLFGLGFGLFQNLTQYHIAERSYRIFIIIRLTQVFLIFSIGILLYYLEYSANSLVIAYSLSQLILGIVVYIYISYNNKTEDLLQKIKCFFSSNFLDSVKNTVITFIQYSAPLTPVFIGGLLFNEKYIGAYFVFAQMISAPLSVIRRNFLIFLNGEFNTPSKIFKTTVNYNINIIVIMILFVLLGFSLLYVLDEEITNLLLGKQWIGFSYLLMPLALYFILDAILQPLTTLLPLWGNTNFTLFIEGLKLILLVAAIPIAVTLFNIPFIYYIYSFIFIMIITYVLIAVKTATMAMYLKEEFLK